MKKWITSLSVLVVLSIAAVYFFIPAQETFIYSAEARCPGSAVTRFIVNKDRWTKWWPGQKKDSQVYMYKDVKYRINKILLNGFEATVFAGKDSAEGKLSMLSSDKSVLVEWKSVFNHTNNPLLRISSYKRTGEIKNNIQSLVQDIKTFFDNEKNIYGFTASVQKVTDEFLISAKQPLDHYPSMEEVYSIINGIKKYIAAKGGKEKNPPMLNVHSEMPGHYEVMVAIPTTTALPADGNFFFKQMVLGNILVAEITGGLYTVQKAEEEIYNYVTDHQKTSPAIPYQSLVTDRIAEKDTAKWITRLNFPVYY